MTNDAPYQPLRTGNKTVVMSMRIPIGLRDQMIEDMETTGDFNNLNQWIQQAIREFIVKRKEQRRKESERLHGFPGFFAGGRIDRSIRGTPRR